MGQLLSGKQSVQAFAKGISILQQLKQCIPPNLTLHKIQVLIANGYCSIIDVYMTDLWYVAVITY